MILTSALEIWHTHNHFHTLRILDVWYLRKRILNKLFERFTNNFRHSRAAGEVQGFEEVQEHWEIPLRELSLCGRRRRQHRLRGLRPSAAERARRVRNTRKKKTNAEEEEVAMNEGRATRTGNLSGSEKSVDVYNEECYYHQLFLVRKKDNQLYIFVNCIILFRFF